MHQNQTLKALKIIFILPLLMAAGVPVARADDSDDYNFSWLDPEKKIYVLQNRKYRKADGPHLYLLGGIAGESYRQVYQVQPRAAFWFNEDFGLEVFYSARFHSTNNVYRSLEQSTNAGALSSSPYIREIKSQLGILFNWAPWYAKINVFNSILYFDWLFSLGLGTMSTEVGPQEKSKVPTQWQSENLFAVYLGTGHLFHVSEKLMVRLDVMSHFYNARITYITGQNDTAIFSNITYGLGVGLRL